MVKKASPPSKIAATLPGAFLIGGLICLLGQTLIDGYAALGVEQKFCPGRRLLHTGWLSPLC